MNESRSGSILRTAVAGGALLALVGTAFLVGRASIEQVAASTDVAGVGGDESLRWTVKDETVGRSLTFVGQIEATTAPGPLANADGIVTAVTIDAGASVDVGDVLFDVQLRPVVAGRGDIPAFRALQAGARGADVAQLRTFLCDLGTLSECDGSDRFTSAMTAAVNSWHEELGLARDGTVAVGDILWFGALPAQVRSADSLAVGARLAATDRPVTVDAGAPVFDLTVSREQAALVPLGSTVRFGDGIEGVVSEVGPVVSTETTDNSDPAFRITVTGVGSPDDVCRGRAECAELLDGRTTVSVEVSIEVVPARTGPGVPVGAITTDASGQTFVTRTDGTTTAVTILGTSGGIAIVDGVNSGDQIVVDGATDDG